MVYHSHVVTLLIIYKYLAYQLTHGDHAEVSINELTINDGHFVLISACQTSCVSCWPLEHKPVEDNSMNSLHMFIL